MTGADRPGTREAFIPEAVAAVVEALWTQAKDGEPPEPTSPNGETEDWFAAAVQYSDSRASILTDVRAMLTAYARELAQPRPNMGRLAAAQGISITSLRRRYNDAQVNALRHLTAGTGLIDDIIAPFTSIYDEHLLYISDARDKEIDQRSEMGKLYAAHEYRLAEQIGADPLVGAPLSLDPEYGGPAIPNLAQKSKFESGKLYPGHRRRLISDYNPRVMQDALKESNSELLNLWNEWRAHSGN